MNKVSILIIMAIIIFVIAVSATMYVTKDYNSRIIDNEVALKKGTAILREYYPECFPQVEKNLVAEKEDGIWIVYNQGEEPRANGNGTYSTTYGGGIYVKFRESDGKILETGVND